MNKEEKIAFNYYKGCNEKDLLNFEFLGDISKKQVKYMELLLNLIEKQQKEIEKFKNVIENREFTWKQKYEETFEYVKEEFISKDKIRDLKDKLEKSGRCEYSDLEIIKLIEGLLKEE